MINIRGYKKAIREMKPGDTFYLNIISASVAIADYTKELIQTGIIAPDQKELEKMIVPNALDKFINGYALAPQMTYIKLK